MASIPPELQIDPVVNDAIVYAILDLLRGSPGQVPNEVNKAISDVASSLTQTSYFQRLKALDNKTIPITLLNIDGIAVPRSEAVLELASTNPSRAFQFLANVISTAGKLTTEYSYDETAESSLNKYLSNGSLEELITALEEGEVRKDNGSQLYASSSDLLELAKIFAELEALSFLRQNLASKGFNVSATYEKQSNTVTTEKAKLDKGEKTMFPYSNIQWAAIYQLITAIKSNLNKQIPMSNWLYLKGMAGTGKTNVVMR